MRVGPYLGRLGLLALAAPLAACGSGSDGGGFPEGGPNAVTIGGFNVLEAASRLASAQCSHRARCAPFELALAGQDEAACTTKLTSVLETAFQPIPPAILAERTTFDPAKLEACANGWQTAACGPAEQVEPDVCSALFSGKLAADAACMIPEECAAGLFCEAGAPGVCGRCKPLAAAGEDCAGRPCAEGQACVAEGSAWICRPRTAGMGQSCARAAGAACAAGLECVGTSSVASCAPPAELDAPCDRGGVTAPRCRAGAALACDGGRCVMAALAAAGESCGARAFCDLEHSCDASGRCAALPALGEPCAAGGLCGEGGWCAGEACAPLKERGATCGSSLECSGELYCVGSPPDSRCNAINWVECS